jgi:hypothetical protein
MNGLADIIPLDSRRTRSKRARSAQQTPTRAAPNATKRRILAFCAALVGLTGLLLVVDRAVISRPTATAAPAAALSAELRRTLHERTLADVASSCALPEAQVGLLRQHCVDQARFLEKLGQCTGDCARLTADILSVP